MTAGKGTGRSSQLNLAGTHRAASSTGSTSMQIRKGHPFLWAPRPTLCWAALLTYRMALSVPPDPLLVMHFPLMGPLGSLGRVSPFRMACSEATSSWHCRCTAATASAFVLSLTSATAFMVSISARAPASSARSRLSSSDSASTFAPSWGWGSRAVGDGEQPLFPSLQGPLYRRPSNLGVLQPSSCSHDPHTFTRPRPAHQAPPPSHLALPCAARSHAFPPPPPPLFPD